MSGLRYVSVSCKIWLSSSPPGRPNVSTPLDPRSIQSWDRAPNVAFAAFVATPDFVLTASRQREEAARPVSDASAAVYKFMFGKFAAWMVTEKLKMSTVNA